VFDVVMNRREQVRCLPPLNERLTTARRPTKALMWPRSMVSAQASPGCCRPLRGTPSFAGLTQPSAPSTTVYERRGEGVVIHRLLTRCGSMTTLIFFLCTCALAQSPPQTSPGRDDQAGNDQDIRTQRALESIAAELRALREQATAKEQREAARDAKPGSPIWSNWILIVVTGGAVLAAFRTIGQLKRQVTANTDQATAAKTTAEAVILAERAYISVSHHPPGVEIDESTVTRAGEESVGGWHDVKFRFGIANQGNTPARVTDIVMGHHIGHPSLIPSAPSGPGTGEHLFLVKGETVDDDRTFQIADAAYRQLGSTLRLWMLGYVDYIDTFNTRRRAGYARYYDPSIDQDSLYMSHQTGFDEARYKLRNNLPFVTQRGYNYDRPRVKGEGNDWD
jgi:hypothetical protein